jgi:nicotinate-nucleotide adenylyltransferase
VKYCIFGGAFDPPHQGHLYLAQSAYQALNFDRIFWVPTQDPPHKAKPGTTFAHRLAMVKLLIQDQAKFQVSDIEASLPTPSYSLNLIRALKSMYGSNHDWHFLIGADNWAIFPSWHQPSKVLEEVTLVVFPREGTSLVLSSLPNHVLGLDMPEMPIQSSLIRESLANNSDLEQAHVPEAIRPYILSNQLYGMTKE